MISLTAFRSVLADAVCPTFCCTVCFGVPLGYFISSALVQTDRFMARVLFICLPLSMSVYLYVCCLFVSFHVISFYSVLKTFLFHRA